MNTTFLHVRDRLAQALQRTARMEAIETLQRSSAAKPDVLSLAGGLPHEALFPRRELANAFMSAVDRPRCAALQYGWPEGDAGLRAWIADRLRRRGARVSDEDVVITNGAQEAIALAVEQLCARGRRVGVDRETYPAALDLFRNRDVIPVSNSDDVDWVYAMPGIGNPRGDAMAPERHRTLVAAGRPVIADEAYAELRFDGHVDRPLLADARDHVWHVGTFSKVLCPGLRVGWLVPPPAARDAVVRARRDRDLQVGSLAQAVVAAFVARDDFDARLAKTRAFYELRANRLVAALRTQLPSWRFSEPKGGFSVFVETDLEGNAASLLARALRFGVSFDPGCLFQVDRGGALLAVRLCHSSVARLEDIDEAVARLAELRAIWLA